MRYTFAVILLSIGSAMPPPGMTGHVAISVVLCNYISSCLDVVDRVANQANASGVSSNLSQLVASTREEMKTLMEIPLIRSESLASFDATAVRCIDTLDTIWEISSDVWKRLLEAKLKDRGGLTGAHTLFRDFRLDAEAMLFLAKRVAGDLDVWLPNHPTNAAAKNMHLARGVFSAGFKDAFVGNFGDAINSHLRARDISRKASYFAAILTLNEMKERVTAAEVAASKYRQFLARVAITLFAAYIFSASNTLRCRGTQLFTYFQSVISKQLSQI